MTCPRINTAIGPAISEKVFENVDRLMNGQRSHWHRSGERVY